jgi:hypothetical protein
MRILIGFCLLGAVTTFGSAAIAAGFPMPGVLQQMSPVVEIKDDHNGKGKHHHQGDNGDEGGQHHCKGKSCKHNGNAERDSDENSTSNQETKTPGTNPNSDVLWGDYKYVKP